jgi:hypothetical protein
MMMAIVSSFKQVNPSRSPLTYGMGIKKRPAIKNQSQAGSLSCWMNEWHHTFLRVGNSKKQWVYGVTLNYEKV